MSFILDALRKSESERQIDAQPDVMHAPLAMPRHRLPVWAIVLIATLTTALTLLSAVWWLDLGPRSSTPLASATVNSDPGSFESNTPDVDRSGPALAAPQTANERSTQARVAPATRQTPAGSVAPSPAEEFSSEPLVASSADVALNRPTSVQAETVVASPIDAGASSDRFAELPSSAQLAAEGIAVPSLSLQLLVNAANPTSRFAIINGQRYGEGDGLSEGPEVLAIIPEGVALEYRGRQFLLTPD